MMYKPLFGKYIGILESSEDFKRFQNDVSKNSELQTPWRNIIPLYFYLVISFIKYMGEFHSLAKYHYNFNFSFS